ncbi:MAG TPA: hypothetical protein VH989_07990 [Actinomycetota bacterium]
MGELTGSASRALAQRTSRRGFIGKLGRGVVALAGGGLVAAALAPERAGAHHICGHTFTTGSCPHPYKPLSRVDKFGYPVHPDYGYPVDDEGDLFTDPDTQERTKTCEEYVHTKYTFVKHPKYGGGWTRCCTGRLRHIQDCCSHSKIRINGDASVHGYCPGNLRVFCITYRELNVTC